MSLTPFKACEIALPSSRPTLSRDSSLIYMGDWPDVLFATYMPATSADYIGFHKYRQYPLSKLIISLQRFRKSKYESLFPIRAILYLEPVRFHRQANKSTF
jgi:hypothetical protein